MPTRRQETRKRRLLNKLARSSSHYTRRTDKILRLNPVAIPYTSGTENTWKFEDSRAIKDGKSPLRIMGDRKPRSPMAEREAFRLESFKELLRVRETMKLMPLERRRRIVKFRDGVLLLHCGKIVPREEIWTRIPGGYEP